MTANTAAGGRTLQPVTGRGWRLGFANMLANENGKWWGTRRWLVQLAIFMLLTNGMVLIMAVSSSGSGGAPAELMAEAADVFVAMLALVTSIGIVVIAQGALIGERQLGTAAWVMSKPASRAGFVLSKFVAYWTTLLLLALPIPTAIFYAEALGFWSVAPSLLNMLGALALAALHFTFYLALTLVLGTLFASRGPVAGIGIGLLIGGLLLGGSLPLAPYVLPWPLPELVLSVMLGQSLPAVWPIPVIATTVWTVLFMVIALWRFGREEF
jgi:ABC-2 type transport system permease protein